MDTIQQQKEDARIIRTKRDLANALEELLQERSFDELSVKDITDRALISKNTFYNNFHDKNELLDFLFARYKDQILKDIEPYLQKNTIILRKVFFRITLEKIIHALYTLNLPLDKMIKADQSRSLFFCLTKFIKETIEKLDEGYNNLITKKANTTITASFFAGAFTATLYFSALAEVPYTEDQLFKSLLKLASPVVE